MSTLLLKTFEECICIPEIFEKGNLGTIFFAVWEWVVLA